MNKFVKMISSLIFSCGLFSVNAAELNYNMYQLSTTAEQQVKNDTMKVTLVASHQDQQSSIVSKMVNQQMAAALTLLKSTSDIDYQTGNYQTHPNYQHQKINGWRASQQLILTSKDTEQLATLIGKLQQHLKVSTMSFEVSKLQQQLSKNTI